MDAPSPSTPAPSAPPPSAPSPSAPMTGLVYADVPNRAVAYIIDAIIVGIIAGIINSILGGMGLNAVSLDSNLQLSINAVGLIVQGIVSLAISAGYFIYTWTAMRATVGMRLLGMQIGNAGDGRTLTTEQAIRRYLAISAPGILAQVLWPAPAIGALVGLLAFIWFLYLIYSTAQSPTKQGWHDVFAHTQVVKAAKTV